MNKKYTCLECGKKTADYLGNCECKTITILQGKIEGKEDSFFYEGEIAATTKPNGTRLTLIACGDVRIRIGDEDYKNQQRFEAIETHKLTDKKLQELENKGEIEWLNNNWFEVTFIKKGSNVVDYVMGDVAYDYDEAISLLKSYENDDTF